MTTLTTDQQTALRDFRVFMLSDTQHEMILTGGAGTGKSFVVSQILETLDQIYKFGNAVKGSTTKYTPTLTATTNKAAAALTIQIDEEVVTLHSLFKLVPVWNPILRRNELKKRKASKGTAEPLLKDLLIIIDEYSYIDEPFYMLMHKYTENCKFLYVGDHCQLPPVGYELPYIYTLKLPTAHLNEIVRQKSDNLIAKLSQDFRKAIDEDLVIPQLTVDNKNIFYLNERDFQLALINDIKNGLNAVYVAYTNAAVQRYNEGMYKLFSSSTRAYNKGDPVVVNSPIKLGSTGLLKTESITFLDNVKTCKYVLPHTNESIPGYRLQIEGFYFFMPLDLSLKAQIMQNGDTPLDVVEDIMNTWVSVRHAYACTVHKTQGSTFDAVYVDLNDIAKAANTQSYNLYRRLLYVALSRPRTKLIFTGVLW